MSHLFLWSIHPHRADVFRKRAVSLEPLLVGCFRQFEPDGTRKNEQSSISHQSQSRRGYDVSMGFRDAQSPGDHAHRSEMDLVVSSSRSKAGRPIS